MARILWHGIGPWHKTAYGQQTALFVPRLAGLGHELAVAVMGRKHVDGDPKRAHPDSTLHTGRWRDWPVIGVGASEFALPGVSAIRDAFGGHDPDLVIVLKDAWVLEPAAYKRWPAAVWANIDCTPMGEPDAEFFRRSGARPIATSKFGLSMMRGAGFKDALYIPHGIDQAQWGPMDRGEARELLGLPADAFICGINAANTGGPRKGWGEQLSAFAEQYHRFGRNSLLLIHAHPEHPESEYNLRHLARRLNIEDAVKFGSQANMTLAQMRSWYCSLNVLLQCTYGEGFGVPIAEAHACGIPVIGTDCSAISEKILPGTGHLVSCQPWWHPHYQAWWHIPRTREITAKMGRPLGKIPEPYRVLYDADMITREYWKPALEDLLDG